MRDEVWLASRRALSDAADARLARSAALANGVRPAHATTKTPAPSMLPRSAPAAPASAPPLAPAPSPTPPPPPPPLLVASANTRERLSSTGELAELRRRLAATEAAVRRGEGQRDALQGQLERERKLREDADGALQWLTRQVKRAGVTAAVAAGPESAMKTRAPSTGTAGSGSKEGFTRALLTKEEAQAVVDRVEEEGERRIREVEDELLEHLAAGSIQRHCRARRARKALVDLGRRMVTAERRADHAVAECTLMRATAADAAQAQQNAERETEDAQQRAQESKEMMTRAMDVLQKAESAGAGDNALINPLSQAVAQMARKAAATAQNEVRKANEGKQALAVAEAEARRAADGAVRMARQRGSMVHVERTMREEAEQRELENAMRLTTLELRWQKGVNRRVQRVRCANYFLVWASYVKKKRRMQSLVRKAVGHIQHQGVVSAFRQWATQATHSVLLRRWDELKLPTEAVALLMEAHGVVPKGTGVEAAEKLGIGIAPRERACGRVQASSTAVDFVHLRYKP